MNFQTNDRQVNNFFRRKLHEQIYMQELRLKQYEKLHLELYNMKIELLDAKTSIEEKNQIIKHLESTCASLTNENKFLVSHASTLCKQIPSPL
jgi:hypothetical protein